MDCQIPTKNKGIADLRKHQRLANSRMEIDQFELKNFQLSNAFDKIAKLPNMGIKKTSDIIVNLLKQSEVEKEPIHIESSAFNNESGQERVKNCKEKMTNELKNKKQENRNKIDSLVNSTNFKQRSMIYSLRDREANTKKSGITDDKTVKQMQLKQSGISNTGFGTDNSSEKFRRVNAKAVDNSKSTHDYWLKKFMKYEGQGEMVGFLDQSSQAQKFELAKINSLNFGPIDFSNEELDENKYIRNRLEENRYPRITSKPRDENLSSYTSRLRRLKKSSNIKNVCQGSMNSNENSINVSFVENSKRNDFINRTYSVDNDYQNSSNDFEKLAFKPMNVGQSNCFIDQMQIGSNDFDILLETENQQIKSSDQTKPDNPQVPKIQINQESKFTDSNQNLKKGVSINQNTLEPFPIKVNTQITEYYDVQTPYIQGSDYIPDKKNNTCTSVLTQSFIIKNERPYLHNTPNRHRNCADRKYAEKNPYKNLAALNRSVSPTIGKTIKSLTKASNEYSKIICQDRGMSNLTYRKHHPKDKIKKKYGKFYDGVKVNQEVLRMIMKNKVDGQHKSLLEQVTNDKKEEYDFNKLKRVQRFLLNYDQSFKSDNTWYGLCEKFQDIMNMTDKSQNHINGLRRTKKKFEQHEHIAKHKRKIFNVSNMNLTQRFSKDDESENEEKTSPKSNKQSSSKMIN